MNNLKETLISYADRYETKEFIKNDPVQFCHKYIGKQDCEIIGFIASWLSYGSRSQFIAVIDYIITEIMDDKPYEYINFKTEEEARNMAYILCNTFIQKLIERF